MEIPSSAFTALLNDLTNRPLTINKYRNQAGDGRSQAFGVVGRRCLKPDYSRQNWLRPYTFKLLKDFADQYVDVSWNAVTVNMNYKAAPHYDKNNVGDSFLVAFGDYTGGELEIHEGDSSGLWDIRHKPIVKNFSTILHSVKEFEGKRFSLVYYLYDLKGAVLPPCSVKEENGEWYFYRGDEKILKKTGLPHPLRKVRVKN
jgi:hypothetical protein